MLGIIAVLFIICIIILCISVLPVKINSAEYVKHINKIPGPKGLPIIGHVYELYLPPDKILPTMLRIINKHGSPVKIWALGKAYTGVCTPEDVEILVNNVRYIDKGEDYEYMKPWLGLGLLTSTGSKWHTHRKMLTPAFHSQILIQHVHVFNDNSEILVKKLTERMNSEWVNMNKYIDLCALDIICESTMGTSVHAQNGGKVEYVHAVKRMSELLHRRTMCCWLWKDWAFKLSPTYWEQVKILKILHTFTDEVIRERKAEYKAMGPVAETEETYTRKRRLAFLDLLIEVSEKEGLLTDRDIREEVDTFMFEGHDTVSANISWCLWLLGLHPDVQELAVEELRGIFGNSDRPATHDDLQNMKYLERVIKESLRLYPSVPMMSRKLPMDLQIREYTIPAGTDIGIMTYALHRNPKSFPDPEKFDPERFTPEMCQRRHPFAYIPFSAGPRNCIGQKFAILEEKALISAVLRKFELRSLDNQDKVLGNAELVLRPKRGLRMKLTPRKM